MGLQIVKILGFDVAVKRGYVNCKTGVIH